MIDNKTYLNQYEIEYRGMATNTSPFFFTQHIKSYFTKKDIPLALEYAPQAFEVGIVTQKRLKLKLLNMGLILLEMYILPGLFFSLLGINRFRIHNVGIGISLLLSFISSVLVVCFLPCPTTFIILGIVVVYGFIDLFVSRRACSQYNLKLLTQYLALI